jgi:hypothetical protein
MEKDPFKWWNMMEAANIFPGEILPRELLVLIIN